MIKAENHFYDETAKKQYVQKVENAFEEALDKTVAHILDGFSGNLLTLSGPTCSGKTTMANKLVSELSERGHRVHVVSIDDFYLDRDVLAKNAEARGVTLDFDSPLSIDIEALSRSVKDIFSGGEVALPTFDFRSGCRTGWRKLTVGEGDIFLFEGIQAVYPEVTSLFSGTPCRSIYVSPQEAISVGDALFLPNEIRFFRRLVRDFRFRDATPAFTFFLWESVRQNEESNIFPYASSADVTFNTVLDYEIGMLTPHLMKLLATLPPSDKHFREAERMMSSLSSVTPIDEAYLPKISMYHEFLG